jgi:MFS family permease
MFRFITPALFTSEFILLCLASLFFFSCYHLLTPILPQYFAAENLSGLAIGSLMAAFMVASMMIRPWVGKLSDEVSRKTLMLLGISIFTVCPLLYPLTNMELLLYGIRLLHGVGFAIFYTASASYLISIVPPQNKAEGISYYSNAIKVAMAFSPSLGIFLASQGLINWAFWASFGMGLVTLSCVLLLKSPQKNTESTAKKAKGKLFNTKALFPGVIMATNSIVFGALIPYIPMLAQEKALTQAGLFYTVYAIFLIGSRFLTGRLSDTMGRDRVVLPGMAAVILTLLMLSWSPSEPIFLAAAALYGLAAGTVQPSLMAIAADRANQGEQGSAMATFTLMSDSGIALGSFLMGALGERFGFGPSLMVIAIVTTLGWAAFFVNSRPAGWMQRTRRVP